MKAMGLCYREARGIAREIHMWENLGRSVEYVSMRPQLSRSVDVREIDKKDK